MGKSRSFLYKRLYIERNADEISIDLLYFGGGDVMEDPAALEQPEQEVPPSDDSIEPEEKTEEDDRFPLFPPAPPVCELDFTETESFPFPFEDELRIDYLHFPSKLFLTTEQALYDYDTMWQLLEKNFPYFEAIKREFGIDWEEVKVEYRQVLTSRAYGGYISQGGDFVQAIDSCLWEFRSVGHLFLVSGKSRAFLLADYKNAEDAPIANLFKILNNTKSELLFQNFCPHAAGRAPHIPPHGISRSGSSRPFPADRPGP